MPNAVSHPHAVGVTPDRVRRHGAAVALYSSAGVNEGASHALALTARELDDLGLSPTVIAIDGYVGRELMWAGVDTTVLRRGPGEAWRLRRALRAIGAGVLIVSCARDERIAAFATFGLKVTVLRMKLADLDQETRQSDAKAIARLVGRQLRPIQSA